MLKFKTQNSKLKIQNYLLLLLSLSPLLPLSPAFSQAFNDIEWYDVDSLLSVLPGQQSEARLQTLNYLAASLSFEEKRESEHYAHEALALARQLGDKKGEADAFRNLGRMEFYDGNYPRALNHYQEALRIYEETENFYLVAQTLEDIGTTHYFAGNLDKAFEIMDMALEVLRQKQQNGSTVGGARDSMTIYSRIGLPYRNIGRSDISLKIYLNYLKIGKENHFEKTDMMLHHGLVALCYYETGMLDSAIFYFELSNNFSDENSSIRAMKKTNLLRMANIYQELGKTDTVIQLLNQVNSWFSKRGFLKQAQIATVKMGDIFFEKGKLSKAEQYYLESERLLEEMIQKGSYYRYDSLKYIVSWGYELFLPFNKKDMKESNYTQAAALYNRMYKLYIKQNRLGNAMDYLISYSNAKDTLRTLERNRESIEIQSKYETERKDSEIIQLSQQNELKEMQLKQTRLFLFGLGGMVLLILLLAVILIRQSRLRATQEKLIIQQKLLRSQMNPHFLFNSLTSIQNFMIQEKDSTASNYLSRFSRLMRHILNSSAQEMVTLEEETDTIENYLALQKVRFRDMFEYTIEIEDDIDPEFILLPPMLAQPFIENSIEHGFKNKEGKGHLVIHFSRAGERLKLEITDDGIGREKAMEIMEKQDKDHRSMATNITRERLQALNRRSKKKIELHIEDLFDEKGNASGTKVSFEIPITS